MTPYPGFGARKYANGAAVFFVKFSVGSQQRRKSLGRVSKGNLETKYLKHRANDMRKKSLVEVTPRRQHHQG